MRSIRFRLLVLILSTLLLIWILLVAFTWWRATAEINEVFDAQLTQITRLLAVISLHESKEQDLKEFELDLQRQEYEFPVIFQVWSAGGELLVRGPNAPHFPLSRDTGYGFSSGLFSEQEWRVFTLPLKNKSCWIQVAHAQSIRDELIGRFALNCLKPLLFVLPFIVVLWIEIDRGLAPLRWVARQVSRRSPANLVPVPTARVPVEISGLVNEINALFSQLQRAIDRHSRFAANTAHELRTPIAGAMMQVDAALNATNEQQRQRSLNQAVKGLEQLGHRLEQLLILARVEPERISASFSQIELNALAEEALSDLAPQALEKDIEILLQTPDPTSVKGSKELLDIMLSNLLDNAIHATPAGGQVLLRTGSTPTSVFVAIEDTGPGVSDEDKKRIFDRYQRLSETTGSGSGLGLSIVQAIAEAHGAQVSLSDRKDRSGLVATVEFSS